MNAHKRHLLGLGLVALATVAQAIEGWAFGQEAAAQRPAPDFGSYLPVYGQGFASDDELDAAVGLITVEITRCNPSNTQEIAASVRIDKPNYESGPIIDAILYRAAQEVWRQCPVNFAYFNGAPTGTHAYNIAEVNIYLPDGTRALQAWNLRGDIFLGPGKSYAWQGVTDFAAQQRQAGQVSHEGPSPWKYIWGTIALIFDLFVLGLVLWGVYALRIPVARWYYFNFHPHPAEPMVEHALRSGTVLDGRALARALGDVPESRILAKVRLEQGERLVALMQEASNARAREFERRAAKDYERAALITIQEAIALAAVALEKAKTLFRASQSIGR